MQKFLIIAGLFIAAIGFVWQYRWWLNQHQGFALVALTAALVVATGTYTYLTYETLRAIQRVDLALEITGSGLPSTVYIANLGATHVLILNGTARIEELSHEFQWFGTETIAPGGRIHQDFRHHLLQALDQQGLPPKRLHQKGGTRPGQPVHDMYYYDPPTMYTVEISLNYYAVGQRQPQKKIRRGYLFSGTLDDSYGGEVTEVKEKFESLRLDR